MILTCPECATRYSVPDGSVGAEGRTVRCVNCGLTWRAEREAALEPEGAPGPELSPTLSGDELPRAFRERIAAQHRGVRSARSGLILGVSAAAVAALVLGLFVGRDGVVQAWPKSASVYAALGLPVNSVGLEIEARTEPLGFYDGRPAAIVTGTLRNVRDRPVDVPPLRFTLLSADQEVLDTRIHRIANVEIEPGAKRTFAVRLVNPPEPTQNVDVSFVLEKGPAPAASHPAARHEPELRPAHAEAGH